MAPRENLPGWMFSGEEPISRNSSSSVLSIDHPLVHLLPRLKEYLAIVDPERIDRAMELLVNSETEEELFTDLQAQYGDVVVPEASTGELASAPSTTRVVHSISSKQSDKTIIPKPDGLRAKRSRIHSPEDDEDLSDFIVDDTDEDDGESDEESEYTESESELDEPEPDEDLRKRKRSPKQPPPPPAAPPTPFKTRLPPGPTVICKYGKACYRRNPVHFQEFAHPWILNPPS
jgi:hypothetical protein